MNTPRPEPDVAGYFRAFDIRVEAKGLTLEEIAVLEEIQAVISRPIDDVIESVNTAPPSMGARLPFRDWDFLTRTFKR